MFFYYTSAGILYLADDSNCSPEICRVGGKIKNILFYEADNSILLLTYNALLIKCLISFNENLAHKKTKLSIPGNPETIQCCWAGSNLLALINEDDLIRLYNIETERSYFISISDHYKSLIVEQDVISCIEYSFNKRTLFAGTKSGKLYLWKCNVTSNFVSTSVDSWEPFCVVETMPDMLLLRCSNNNGLLSIGCCDNDNKLNKISMLSETILKKRSNKYLNIIQTSHKTIEVIVYKNAFNLFNNEGKLKKNSNNNTENISIQSIENSQVRTLELKEIAKGIEIYCNKFIVYNSNFISIYEVQLNKVVISLLNTITTINSNLVVLNDDSLIVSNKRFIEIYNFEGHKKSEVEIDSKFGDISHFNVNNNYLLVCTKSNYFSVYDIERRNLKILFSFRKFEKDSSDIGEIREAVIDSSGKKIIFLSDFLANSEQRIPDTFFNIYSFETEQYSEYEISTNRVPTEAFFDCYDNRIFGINTEFVIDELSKENDIVNINNEKNKLENNNWLGQKFYMFFHNEDSSIKLQESHKINNEIKGVLCINLPDLFFIKSSSNETNKGNDSINHSLVLKKFQFFIGMDFISIDIKNILIEFSILISSGKIDEAYKVVKNIKSQKIWENIASACIKNKRLDVLEVCLSNMRFGIGMKALRESKHEKEVEVSLALVAMHLGMIDQAICLLEEVKRYDMLVRFYIAIGEYEKSIETAKTKNRINLQNTYYRIAQHQERNNEIDKAIENYKLSLCGDREIPRMLILKGRIDLLEKYMNLEINENKSSMNWWAAFLESRGEIEKALVYYEKASDYSNIVRILLALNKIEDAKKLTDETKDEGACFLMGKYYESIGNIKLAIYYFALSGRINQAFRLARDYNMDAEIYNLGLKANSQTQNLIADYFEKKDSHEKAINLYIMSKNIKAAMNLCLLTKNYDKLNEIAEMIEFQNDPDALRKLAEYFLEHKEYERALRIYIKLKDWAKCLYICENFKIKISLNTAHSMLNELDLLDDSKEKEELTLKLAKQLKQQGEFELSHNIYVKYGDLTSAMKCLILLGNKDRVISFANTCRHNELFVMAANYLQSLDWNDSEDIIKNIVSFYSKAKAWINLSNFYENFASIEVTEYRNYNKALELYNEALKVIVNKISDEDYEKIPDKFKNGILTKAEKIQEIEDKKKVTVIYSNALSKAKTEPDEALGLCNKLLNSIGLEKVIKEIDIYTLMLEIYLQNKDYPSCFSVFEVLRTSGKKIDRFIDYKTIEIILKSVDKLHMIKEYVTSDNNKNEDDIHEELVS